MQSDAFLIRCNSIFNGFGVINDNALWLEDGIIKAIGMFDELSKQLPNSVNIIDAQNQFVMPAFIEGHGHFTNLGYSKMKLDFSTCSNWNEVLKLVKNKVENTPSNNWLEGEGWHQEKWDKAAELIEGFPTNTVLNKIAPNHPVVLWHAAMHSCVVNKKALQLAQLSISSKIEGGKIIQHNNKLTGALDENATNPIRKLLQQYYEQNENRFYKAINLASIQCLKNGITFFQDADIRLPDYEKYSSKKGAEALSVDVWMMLHESAENLLKLSKTFPYKKNKITIGAIKRYMDGAIGNRGAWLLNAYEDAPNNYGHCTLAINEYEQICNFAAQHNLQMATHAIGDKANNTVLNFYEKIIRQHQLKDHRWRVEHAQHLHPNDINRFAENNILASIQTNHCTSDASYVLNRFGKKRIKEGGYKWKSLWQSGAKINNGTDCPIESIDPIKNFYAAVTRKYKSEEPSFYPDECLNRQQALQAYTVNNAYAAKQEQIRGSLEVGKLADITILNKNLLTIPHEEILTTKVLTTIKAGKLAYQNGL